MAYLVTGGTGYLGSYIVRDLLAAGKKDIVCLQRSGVTPLFREVVGDEGIKKVKLIQGDVSNAVQLFNIIKQNDISLVIHLGYLMPPNSEMQPGWAVQVNCGGMNNVLEAARLFGLKRVIWSSSSKAFGRMGELYQEPVGDDNAIFMPNSMYGACKVVNEFMTKLYFEKFGVDTIGIRLARTFGTGRTRGGVAAFADFLRKAALDMPATIGEGDVATGYMYVEDCSDLIVKVCDIPTTRTRVFNAIEGMFTHKQMAEMVLKAHPKAKLAVEGGYQGPIFAGSRMPNIDTTGLRTELGWRPKYGMEAGIKKVLNYYRQQEGMPPL